MNTKIKHHFVYEIAKEVFQPDKDELMTVLNIIESIVRVSDEDSATRYMLTIASQILCLLSRADTPESLEINLRNFKKFLEA